MTQNLTKFLVVCGIGVVKIPTPSNSRATTPRTTLREAGSRANSRSNTPRGASKESRQKENRTTTPREGPGKPSQAFANSTLYVFDLSLTTLSKPPRSHPHRLRNETSTHHNPTLRRSKRSSRSAMPTAAGLEAIPNVIAGCIVGNVGPCRRRSRLRGSGRL